MRAGSADRGGSIARGTRGRPGGASRASKAPLAKAPALERVGTDQTDRLGYQRISAQDGVWGVLTTKGDRDVVETIRLIGTRALERWGLR